MGWEIIYLCGIKVIMARQSKESALWWLGCVQRIGKLVGYSLSDIDRFD
jgi:hypothetical protein